MRLILYHYMRLPRLEKYCLDMKSALGGATLHWYQGELNQVTFLYVVLVTPEPPYTWASVIMFKPRSLAGAPAQRISPLSSPLRLASMSTRLEPSFLFFFSPCASLLTFHLSIVFSDISLLRVA